jgi:hypothetical protein
MADLPSEETQGGREKSYEIVYKEAIRALDLQRGSFDALRARVGFLLSAATIATSFLGGLALRAHNPDAGSWAAIGLFGVFGVSALRILWPQAEGADGFTAKPSVVIEQYLEPDEGEAQPTWTLYRDLALRAEVAHDHNRSTHLQPLALFFRASIVLLFAEIATWVVDLALR